MTVPIELTPSENIIELRQSLRRNALAARDELPAELRQKWSTQILAQLQNHVAGKHYDFIHCYLNFRSEVETREFIKLALQNGSRIVVPVVERIDSAAEGEPHEHLAHTEIQEIEGLVKGRFGIEEPELRSPASLENLDAVIVPIVAFDRRGTRLGYGKGFYDVFLRELPRAVQRIGLAFSMQEITHIPSLPHDEPLDLIITEREIIHTIA